MRTIHLESVRNVRDLGGLRTRDGRTVKRGLFFRGSSLHKATAPDIWILREDLNIGCVIDLRCGWEVEAKPNVEIEGVEYLHIPFYDKEKVGIDYDKSAPGTIKIGHDFACVPADFYRSLANPLTIAQMRKCIHEAFSRAGDGYAVYQHCSGGKDRTGVISMLLLAVLGVRKEDVLQDYLMTNVDRDSDIERVRDRFLRLAQGDAALADELTESHRAKPEHLSAFVDAIEEGYETMEAFIEKGLKIDEPMRESLHDRFTVSPDEAKPAHGHLREDASISWRQDTSVKNRNRSLPTCP